MNMKALFAKLRTTRVKQSIHHNFGKKELTRLYTNHMRVVVPDNYKRIAKLN